MVTEHYSKALGTTVPDLNIQADLNKNTFLYQKTKFSMLTDEVKENFMIKIPNQLSPTVPVSSSVQYIYDLFYNCL